VRLTGVGGARLAALGMEMIERNEQLAVMGFVEVLRHVPKHYRLLGQITRTLRSGRVDLVVLLDYPGFNMKVAAATLVQQQRPEVEVIVAGAPTIVLRDDDVPFRIIRGASFPILRAANAALCKSGTTTLEAAVADCPLVVVYRTNALTYTMAKRLVRIPRIGLVNVVADREVAPEFVQEAFTPAAVAAALLPLLDRTSPARAAMCHGLAEVRERLGSPGASGRVAAIADALLP
jgi:lipid A disaccharide synthetase